MGQTADERHGQEDGHHVTLAHCQCWALIGHFEAQHLWFARASMSTSRAVRLSQILGIHLLDGPGPINQVLPPPRDWSEAEERRRTFWTIFCIDRGTSSTTTWPVLVDVNQVSKHADGRGRLMTDCSIASRFQPAFLDQKKPTERASKACPSHFLKHLAMRISRGPPLLAGWWPCTSSTSVSTVTILLLATSRLHPSMKRTTSSGAKSDGWTAA